MFWCPQAYEKAAVIAEIAGDELYSRLDWMTIRPQTILDVGCGTGRFSTMLCNRYPQASIFAIDSSELMLQAFPGQHAKVKLLRADGCQLPFLPASIDLIFANMFLPWQQDLSQVFQEWRRVLRADGLVLFTAFGPDSLKNCQSRLGADALPCFFDMHDIGDALLHCGLSDPVLDVDHITVSYQEENHLINELRASGMWMPNTVDAEAIDTNAKQPLPLELPYEIIYGHAFAPTKRAEGDPPEKAVRIPLSQLRQQLKSQQKV